MELEQPVATRVYRDLLSSGLNGARGQQRWGEADQASCDIRESATQLINLPVR